MVSENILFPLTLAFLAGLATAAGGLICLFVHRFSSRLLAFGLGLSAGVMIYVSFAELLSSAVAQLGFLEANLAFFGGMVAIMLIDFFIPHNYIAERACQPAAYAASGAAACCPPACAQGGWKSGGFKGCGFGQGRMGNRGRHNRLAVAGIFTAIGIAIHNLPEGLSVLIGALANPSLGITLAFAITIHNIPEGIAIALPIYHSTRSKGKAFLYALLAGLAEPLGALLGALFLMPFLNPATLMLSLAAVAGIMVFISFDELLPLCFEHCKEGHSAIFGIIIGMMIMAASLQMLT